MDRIRFTDAQFLTLLPIFNQLPKVTGTFSYSLIFFRCPWMVSFGRSKTWTERRGGNGVDDRFSAAFCRSPQRGRQDFPLLPSPPPSTGIAFASARHMYASEWEPRGAASRLKIEQYGHVVWFRIFVSVLMLYFPVTNMYRYSLDCIGLLLETL